MRNGIARPGQESSLAMRRSRALRAEEHVGVEAHAQVLARRRRPEDSVLFEACHVGGGEVNRGKVVEEVLETRQATATLHRLTRLPRREVVASNGVVVIKGHVHKAAGMSLEHAPIARLMVVKEK